jgi:peroxiredoxin
MRLARIYNASSSIRENWLSGLLRSAARKPLEAVPAWAQHSPDDKETLAIIGCRYRFNPLLGLQDYTALSHAMATKNISAVVSMLGTHVDDIGAFGNATIINDDLQDQQAKLPGDVRDWFKQSASGNIDRPMLLRIALSLLSFQNVLPVYAIDLTERSSIFGTSNKELHLASTKGDYPALQAWAKQHKIPAEEISTVRSRRVSYCIPTHGDASSVASLAITAHSDQGLVIRGSGMDRLVEVLAAYCSAAPYVVPTKAEQIVLNPVECGIGTDLTLNDVEIKQRTFDPAKKQNPADVFFKHDLTKVFAPGTKSLIRTFPGGFTDTCTKTDLPDLIKNYPALRAAGIDKVVIVTPDNCDVLYNWVKIVVAEIAQDSTTWLHNNPAVQSPTFIEDHFYLFADHSLGFTNSTLGWGRHNARLDFICARGMVIANGPKIVAMNVEADARVCANVSASAILAVLQQPAAASAAKRASKRLASM